MWQKMLQVGSGGLLGPYNLNHVDWSIITNLVKSGKFGEHYEVGDTKTIALTTGEQVVMQVASINDGTGTAGAYYPANTVDFISVDCLQTSYKFNSSNTNAGSWKSSALRTTLNSTVFETLPSDLQNNIIEKVHYISSGSRNTDLISVSDKLWIPTEWEVHNNNTYSVSTENANYNNKYDIFKDNTSRIKRLGMNGTTCNWYESSPDKGSVLRFCNTSTLGAAYYTDASNAIGVPLCFRIG